MNTEQPEFDHMELVWVMRQSVNEGDPDYFYRILFLQDARIVIKFFKPDRNTLLHRFIRVESELAFRAIYDNYGIDILQDYLLRFSKSKHVNQMKMILSEWNNKRILDQNHPKYFLDDEILPSILSISPLIDQLFYLLFTDRLFLFKFNSVLSKIVASLKASDLPQYLDKDGQISRQYIPKWLKKGIFKRDQGHCVYCGKDLTGVRIIERVHYDHIIPLVAHGCNDPVNFQLLCQECNQKKSGTKRLPPDSELAFW